MFDWYSEKVQMKMLLNSCIRHKLSATKTCKLLNAQFQASCLLCDVQNMGHCPCQKHHKCFLNEALKTYKKVARQQLGRKEEK